MATSILHSLGWFHMPSPVTYVITVTPRLRKYNILALINKGERNYSTQDLVFQVYEGWQVYHVPYQDHHHDCRRSVQQFLFVCFSQHLKIQKSTLQTTIAIYYKRDSCWRNLKYSNTTARIALKSYHKLLSKKFISPDYSCCNKIWRQLSIGYISNFSFLKLFTGYKFHHSW